MLLGGSDKSKYSTTLIGVKQLYGVDINFEM